MLVFVLVFNAAYFAVAASSRNNELEYQWNLAVYSSKSTDEATYSEFEQPSANIESDDPDIIALAHSIVKGIKNDYEKARAICKWVSENIWYDFDCLEDKTKRGVNSALDTYQSKRGVCVGYSNLTAALLRAIDIPALIAAGHSVRETRTSEDFFDLSESFRKVNHVWTEAYIDGRWVIMDATWASKNVYQNGTYSRKKASSQAFFDMSLRDLSKSHRYSPNYSAAPYPVDEFKVPYGVESIVDYAFWRNARIRGITMPNSVKSIGNAAFGYCTNLKDVTIPDSVSSIGDYAFFRCTSLNSIIIPNSVTKIGKKAFSGCTELKTIHIPASVISIDKNVFIGTPHVTIIGCADSYAQSYAKANSIPFRLDTRSVPSRCR